MPVRTLLTDEEFLALPDSDGKQELLNGELIELPPAKAFHSKMIKILEDRLLTVLDRSRVYVETGFQLAKHRWVAPDLSVIWPDQKEDGWYQRAPMVAIEIASRGNKAEELETKTALYLEFGADEVWVLYPTTRTLVVSRIDSVIRILEGQSYYCESLGLKVVSGFWVPE
jgi:Uma2 family endonuclease